MKKLLRAESWLARVGLMRARGRSGTKQQGVAEPEKNRTATIGILAFELASLMSKAVHLWRSLAGDPVARLRDEATRLEGVRKLVSDDDDFLLGLVLAEMMDSLGCLVRSVARLGNRCSDPVLQRFDQVFADLVNSDADFHGLEYAGRKMERKVRKMERFAAASANLYQELDVLAELEQGLRRMQGSAGPTQLRSLTDFRQRVAWQRQEVKRLREASLWSRSYDDSVRLLARSLVTIIGRIKHVFGIHHKEATGWSAGGSSATSLLPRSHSVTSLMHSSVHPSDANGITRFSSGPLVRPGTTLVEPGSRSGPIAATNRAIGGQCTPRSILPPPSGKRHSIKTKWPVSGRPFSGCMVGGNESPVLQSCIPRDGGFRGSKAVPRIVNGVGDTGSEAHFQDNASTMNLSLYLFGSKHTLLDTLPSTLGASALALHYANVIIVIEKLLAAPHLIGPDARDDLYNMLPTCIRAALRARLKSYAKNLASSVYDPDLAAEWSEAITRILEWLAPLAYNMIKWQSEHNFEQQHLVSSTNILLLQTLYFANQMKTEAAITELLVGLNYLWRFERELNEKTILECASSRNYDDCLDSKGLRYLFNHT